MSFLFFKTLAIHKLQPLTVQNTQIQEEIQSFFFEYLRAETHGSHFQFLKRSIFCTTVALIFSGPARGRKHGSMFCTPVRTRIVGNLGNYQKSIWTSKGYLLRKISIKLMPSGCVQEAFGLNQRQLEQQKTPNRLSFFFFAINTMQTFFEKVALLHQQFLFLSLSKLRCT